MRLTLVDVGRVGLLSGLLALLLLPISRGGSGSLFTSGRGSLFSLALGGLDWCLRSPVSQSYNIKMEYSTLPAVEAGLSAAVDFGGIFKERELRVMKGGEECGVARG